jgi:hypothetical protein
VAARIPPGRDDKNVRPSQPISSHNKRSRKVHLTTGHGGSEGEERYNPTLSLTLALDWSGLSKSFTGRITAGADTRYPLCRRLGGPRAGLDGCGKFRPHRDSVPGPSSP